MGGNVFLVPARRLSTSELLAFLALVKDRLGTYFEGMEITRFFEDKVTHGDLDVMCGLWMGGEGWKGADQEGVLDSNVVQDRPDMREGLGKNKDVQWTREEVKGFAELLASKLGATKWKKHGWEISFAVPCMVLNPEHGEWGPEDFYQLDLLLIRPPSLNFAVMTMSYGVSSLLLSAALRRMSSSFTIHTDRFVVRYSPYHGLPAIEVDLTDDPTLFMEWAGLDAARFEQGFQTEKDFWRWLACLPDDIELLSPHEQEVKKGELFEKRFAQGWKRLARQRQGQMDGTKMPRGHSKARVEVMERFRDYIKSTLYADTPIVLPADGEAPVQELETDKGRLATQPDSPTSPTASQPTQPILDPSKPRDLSERAKDALTYFGQTDTWKDMLVQRRQEAGELAERQQRRLKDRVVPRTPSNSMLVSSSSTTTTETDHGMIIVHEKLMTDKAGLGL